MTCNTVVLMTPNKSNIEEKINNLFKRVNRSFAMFQSSCTGEKHTQTDNILNKTSSVNKNRFESIISV